jgi:magnesium transporter
VEYAIHSNDLESLAASNQPVCDLLENGELGEVWWLDVTAPSEEDIDLLSKVFGIHPLTTEDIGIQETREKIELFGHYYFVSLRSSQPTPNSAGMASSILNQYALIFQGGIISITFGPTPHAANVRSRIMEHKSHLALTSDWICYALM